ncbi:MAG: hypothetical protein HY786_01335 [Deltaproteobacteria bacterium]|nr:hypothetical protein [Deltaproteobacteria bacterium]
MIEGPPSTPTGVNVVVSGSSEVVISWNSVENTTSYNIYWSTVPGVSKSGTKIPDIASTSYTHAGLTNGAAYYYVVTAVNSYGESSESAEVFAKLDVPRPPGAVAAVAGDGQATVSWSTVDGATSYNLYMASQSGVNKTNYASLTDGMSQIGATSPYSHTGLTNGAAYYYVVTAVNSFGEGSESNEVAVTPTATPGSLTVSGSVHYEDKEYGKWQDSTGKWQAGFTGKTTYKAVRYADVQAVDSAGGATIITGTTDATGSYSLTIPSASTIYIRVISSSVSPSVAVKDLSNAFHAVTGPNFTVSGAAMADISIPATSRAAGAFNILDVFTSGAQFIYSLSGSNPPALTAFWQNPKGTYYCSGYDPSWCAGGEGIYVINGSDSDEYDDDVLWHEYGHFIASKYSKDDSPGGAHYLTSNDLDLRLSWSEGWGDFLPGALKAWLKDTSPSLLSAEPAMEPSVYVDTSGASGWYFDFGNPGDFPFLYSSNEAAVAKVLHRLRSNYGMQAVWEVFIYIKVVTTPVNLEAFWDGWNSLGKTDITATLSERSIKYSSDIFEASNENSPNILRKAVVGQAEEHTLYSSGDMDYIAFDAIEGQAYTSETAALVNGADTYIRIIAPDKTAVVADNDNTSGKSYANSVPNNCDAEGECHENGFDILGSTASFTATATGTYYVEVKSSPSRPLSAGRYGGYSLTITSP